MSTFVRVEVLGRFTKKPELKTLDSGNHVVSFSLATNRVWTKDGEKIEKTDFHDLVAWGKQAETICKFCNKGDLLFVNDARLETRSWEAPDETKRYKTEVIVQNFILMPNGKKNNKVEEDEDDDDDFL